MNHTARTAVHYIKRYILYMKVIFLCQTEALHYIHSKNVYHSDLHVKQIFFRGEDVFIGGDQFQTFFKILSVNTGFSQQIFVSVIRFRSVHPE